MNNMAPPHVGSGSSELFNRSSISFDEDFFETDVVEQFPTIPDVRESGSKSPYSLDSTAVASNTSHVSDYPYSELDNARSFPILLHAIVSDESLNSAIHWVECGTIFVIANKEEFTHVILSKYFGGRAGGAMATKFTSFTRRLKRWNFQRIPSGRKMGSYYHENFIRGKPELARKIVYPVFKDPSSPSIRRKIASSATAAVKKAQRRASTGTLTASEITAEDLLVLRATAASRDLDYNISLTPGERIASSQIFLDDDFDKWLNSAEFPDEELDSSSMSSIDNLVGQETSISSNKPTPVSSDISILEFHRPTLPPPPMFSDVVPSEGRKNIGDCTDQAFQMPKKKFRRRTISSPCTTKVTMMSEKFPSLNDSGNNWLDLNQPSFGTNNPYAHNTALSSTSSNKPSPVSSDISILEFHRPKLPPPPMFSDVVPSEGRKDIGDCIDQEFQMSKKKIRRRTISSPCTTKVTMRSEMFPSLNDSGNNWLDLIQPSFGTNMSIVNYNSISSDDVPWAGMNQKNPQGREPYQFHDHVNLADGTDNPYAHNTGVSIANSTGITSDDVSWERTNHNNPQGREPHQFRDHVNLTDSFVEVDSCDAYFRESQFDFACAIDPFT